jgi:hypothetical protein
MWDPPPGSPNPETVLSRLTAYGCTTGIYTGGGIYPIGTIRFDDCTLADNGVHVQFASMDTISNSLIVHDSGHGIFPSSGSYLHNYELGWAYALYDGPGRMLDCHLVGYDGPLGHSVFYGAFGAARRHPGHVVRGLTFAGSVPNSAMVALPNFAALDPTTIDGHPQVFGIAIVDEDGCLRGSFYAGRTLISNHPMMHLIDGLGGSPDVYIGGRAWLSPFAWRHLQVRYYLNVNGGSLIAPNVPKVRFTRHTYNGWLPADFTSQYVPSAQMRQLPVIVRPGGAVTGAEPVYGVHLFAASTGRADLSIDDAVPGDVVRLHVSNEQNPVGWNPTVWVNDGAPMVHDNGQVLASPPLAPPLVAGAGGSGTSYQITTVAGFTTLEIRMVITSRTHRLSLTW